MPTSDQPYQIIRRDAFSDQTYLLEVRHPEMARAAAQASSSP